LLGRALRLLLLIAVLLAAVVLGRALTLPSRQFAVVPAPFLELDERAAAERLAASLRFETVSNQDPAQVSRAAFGAFRGWLAASYPRLHATLARQPIAQHSLLYTWQGSDPDLAPLLLLAHQDVVPVVDAARWTHPPFGGVIADGFVWGRGAIDDKASLVAICEAVEHLLAAGFAPTRTLLLAFGHDEEVGGPRGASAIAQTLAARGVRAELVLDEGMVVAVGALPGIDEPAALIGIAEKGSATIELAVKGAGGHSSMPPRHPYAGIVATAVDHLEAKPLPGGIDGVVGDLFAYLAPEMPLRYRVPLANLWLFGPAVERALAREPATNAMIRTTTAVTMLQGSPKQNVLPQRSTAVANFRIRPGDTSEDVMRHVRRAVDDPRVELAFTRPPREPSPVSPVQGAAFELLARSVAESFPDALVAPALVVGGTDARHYTVVSDAVYRFRPFLFESDSLTRIHGTDERIAIDVFAQGIRFHVRLIQNASKAF
jgi:carboxypeptidase PM20D1